MKILKFYSDTCGPCKVLDTYLKAANIQYEAIDINDDDNGNLLDKYHVKNIPVLIKEKNGEEIDRHVGLMSKSQLEKWCKE